MDIAAAAIAFVQAADMCTSVADSVIQKIRAFRHAGERINDLVIQIEAIWVKTDTQIKALRRIDDQLNDRQRAFYEDCLRRLIAKLCAAAAEIETYTDGPNGPLRRIRYSFFENHLRKTIGDLEAWHKVFDPSWFLITLHPGIDTALQAQPIATYNSFEINVVVAIRTAIQETPADASGPVFRDSRFVSSENVTLPNSGLTLSKLTQNSSEVIVDTTAYPDSVDKQPILKHVRDLARILSCSQPETFGLLQCLGVLKQLDATGRIGQFQYVFAMPSSTSATVPASLRTLLLSDSPSLDAKYSIAQSLTRGVMAVHSADFVHKNIRPDTILCFNAHTDRVVKAYLVGFERSRPVAANTSLIGDMVWERNIYRHPTRQGVRPADVYKMQHDIYSLGVCLLEIGIWSSFVIPSSNSPRPGQAIATDEPLISTNEARAAWEIKNRLTNLAETLLPSSMGLLYTSVVLSCLTCLDSGASNMFAHENDLYDDDGILVGVVFIEKVLSRLEALSIQPHDPA